MKFSKSKYSKGERVKLFFKKYGYLVGIIVAALAITSVGLVAGLTGGNTKTDINVNPPIVDVDGPKVEWHLPVDNVDVIKYYNDTKLQYNETLEDWRIHKAVDFKLDAGDNVYACYDGTVSKVYTNTLEGTVVVIDSEGGIQTVYKSLNKDAVSVKVGAKVKGGDKIGAVDASAGFESKLGAHLHLEILLNGKAVDPANYLNLGNK